MPPQRSLTCSWATQYATASRRACRQAKTIYNLTPAATIFAPHGIFELKDINQLSYTARTAGAAKDMRMCERQSVLCLCVSCLRWLFVLRLLICEHLNISNCCCKQFHMRTVIKAIKISTVIYVHIYRCKNIDMCASAWAVDSCLSVRACVCRTSYSVILYVWATKQIRMAQVADTDRAGRGVWVINSMQCRRYMAYE